jgi:AraC family transcriptional regulator, melibiose operon regulatory protein
MLEWVSRIAFSGNSPLAEQGQNSKFGFQRHRPELMPTSHWHGHIEVNYLFNCSADYQINGKNISVPQGRMILFWALFPHQMIATQGNGEMVNIYIPLQAFLTWKLPSSFVSDLLHGEVIVSDSLYCCDEEVTQIWQKDLATGDRKMTAQVINEIRSRIHRMSIENYSIYNLANKSTQQQSKQTLNGLNHIQTMLRYIADNYDQKLVIDDVSKSTGLHKNYAMKLFNRVMKVSIKQYINQLRLQHAQALLLDTEKPVLNIALEAGFGSVSRFYDIFHREFSTSPLDFRRITR